jgi:hypothetical protein
MADHPIIFSGEMVRAILDGSKTETRRIVQKARFPDGSWADVIYPAAESGWIAWQGAVKPGPHLAEFTKQQYRIGWPCPYGIPGDRLWVRETWMAEELPVFGEDGIRYRADGTFLPIENNREASDRWSAARGDQPMETWRPSIHMPRWASRITLEIVNVRVERVQEISAADMDAEGMRWYAETYGNPYGSVYDTWRYLWDSLHAKRGYPWSDNPWVWVIEFARQYHGA